MYQPDFPTVPFRLGLYPVVDSVEWIERLLESGVRTIQLRIKDKRDEEVEADVIAASRWGVVITPGCLSTITGVWQLSTALTACIWARKTLKPPT